MTRTIRVASAALAAVSLLAGAAGQARAGEAQLLERLERLEGRVGALENALQDRDAKIVGLEKAVRERDAKIETLEKTATEAQTAAASAQKAAAKPPAALALVSPDGNLKIGLRGRINADVALYDEREGGRDFNSGTLMRRARLGIDGQLYDDFGWRIEADFAQGNGVALTDAYVDYKGLAPVSVIMGQHKTPYTLEDRTSANFITFMERGLFVDAFNVGANRKLGISAKASGTHWNAWFGGFGENAQVNGTGDEGWGVNGNVGAAAVNEPGRLVHVGASGYYRGMDASGTVRFSDTPEIQVDGTRLADIGMIPADHYWFTGAEAAAVYGPFSVQGEYGRAGIDRSGPAAGDVAFDGFYAFASYFLTGESRVFKGGAFDRIRPNENFSLKNGGFGAWEIAARVSQLDLDDKNIFGGNETNYTAALNWYLNPNMRAHLNWVRFYVDSVARPDEAGDAVGGRLQVDW